MHVARENARGHLSRLRQGPRTVILTTFFDHLRGWDGPKLDNQHITHHRYGAWSRPYWHRLDDGTLRQDVFQLMWFQCVNPQEA